MLIQNTSDKQIRLCLGKHISSRKCHVLRLDCRPQHGKTTVKSWGFFSPPSHLSMRHQHSERSCMSCDDLMFSLSFATNDKISTWPLTSKCHTEFPFLFISSAFITSSAQKGTPFVPQLLNVASSRASLFASQRKLLNLLQSLSNIEYDSFLYCRHSNGLLLAFFR